MRLGLWARSVSPTVEIIVTSRDGTQHKVDARQGRSLMEALRDHGFDEIEAICDGSVSCGTCHVHVDPALTEKLPPMSRDEDDLLSVSLHRDAGSRLSCQLTCVPGLEGLRVRIAPTG